MSILARLRELHADGALDLPLPGQGETQLRHRKLAGIARFNVALARLAEAHTDAIAILAEAGRAPEPGLYGVWAADTPGLALSLEAGMLSGGKMFCSGAGLLDRALVTVNQLLIDVDLRAHAASLTVDDSAWKTPAFAETKTATVSFSNTPVAGTQIIGRSDWYLQRPGFWHGACGPAACWAGGAIGLYDYAVVQSRDDAHTLAHLGALHADVWALWAFLDQAGAEIDQSPADAETAHIRALAVRHLIEQAVSDILLRLGRAYGPRALAFDDDVARRVRELELYIRQSHAERDLAALGKLVHRFPR